MRLRRLRTSSLEARFRRTCAYLCSLQDELCRFTCVPSLRSYLGSAMALFGQSNAYKVFAQ